jgi:cytochrome o ubiquinol oxidase subunit IV
MTLTRYILGYILSLLLTFVAYAAAVGKDFTTGLVAVLVVLAIIQLVVQLVFFLHLGEEVGPRYKLASFVFMSVILIIIVIGSIWIMYNLDYNMMNMSPQEKSDYMMTQHDKGF